MVRFGADFRFAGTTGAGRWLGEALAELGRQGARGCVVLGSPGYYGRFGFKAQRNLILPGVPPEYFQALCFIGEISEGEVRYDEAFDAQE